ncbi:MAG: sulfatase-like hydrolase/transferase, partial [Planctomycetes bacterium]|nr:sulfatase-like hydrolase/transferase [Planctomycetota bacterium]
WASYQGYHAHVSAIDDELGRLMQKLAELGIAKDTLLIYTSDHGSMLGSHGVGGKRQPYEESIKTPFLAHWPGTVPAGTRSAALFGAIDVMPTVCSLAGIPVPKTCMGQDFSQTVLGKKGPKPESQFIMHISKNHASGGQKHPAPLFRGVTTERYTYAVYPHKPWCLFDNREDPYQQKNLIHAPEHAGTRKAMRAMLVNWLAKAKDPFTIPAEEMR